LHQTAFKIKEAEQAPRVFGHGKFAAQLPSVAREAVRIGGAANLGGGALLTNGDGRNGGRGSALVVHKVKA
jgi:hypothetical protein